METQVRDGVSNRELAGAQQNHYNSNYEEQGTQSSKAIIGNRCNAWSAAKQDIEMPKYARKITRWSPRLLTSNMILYPEGSD